jgi:hypothetical protein
MEIHIPEHIDLTRSEQYILIIGVHPERFSFFLYHPEENTSFYYRIPEEKSSGAFACFQTVFFDHPFFTLTFKQTFLLNYTPAFTCIPNLLFEEKDKETYMRFLFKDTGKIVCQSLQQPDLTILHEMPEEVFRFFQRSFTGIQPVHPIGALITYFQGESQAVNHKRMIVNPYEKGVDILCFSGNDLLLCNHFACLQPSDAVYYILNTWKQLNFDQLNDSLFLTGNTGHLQEKLQPYIRAILPVTIPEKHGMPAEFPDVPFEIFALSLSPFII